MLPRFDYNIIYYRLFYIRKDPVIEACKYVRIRIYADNRKHYKAYALAKAYNSIPSFAFRFVTYVNEKLYVNYVKYNCSELRYRDFVSFVYFVDEFSNFYCVKFVKTKG